ncbi:MAG: PEP-CTERM sorting domain-containing protein [Nitrospinae bacterium]|nr:PEP-CTERM sorting domain-containing protein [Nitrospinota bacterium]
MRRYASKLLVVAMALFTIASGEATAVPIPVEFDITTVSGTNPTRTASGTSNGIGWSVSSTFISGFTIPFDQTQTVFDTLTPSITNPGVYDNLHVGSLNFILTFDVPIFSLLAYIGENSTDLAPGLDFGITPDFVSGAVNFFGTRFAPSSKTGGVVLIKNINSTTLTHTAFGPEFDNDIHFAFFVTPVPEPSTLVLLAIGFAGIVIYARYREQMNGKGQSLKANS